MKVSFTRNFNSQLLEIRDKKLALFVQELIIQAETVTSPWQLKSIKKLKGHKTAYRIRFGDYRVGFFIESGEIIFAAIAPRKDIYKKFP